MHRPVRKMSCLQKDKGKGHYLQSAGHSWAGPWRILQAEAPAVAYVLSAHQSQHVGATRPAQGAVHTRPALCSQRSRIALTYILAHSLSHTLAYWHTRVHTGTLTYFDIHTHTI